MPSVSDAVKVSEHWRVEIQDTSQRLQLSNFEQDETIDLIDGTVKLRDRSWNTGGPTPMENYSPLPRGYIKTFDGFEMQEEELELVATSNPITSGVYNDLEDTIEAIRKYQDDPVESESYWLDWNVEGEKQKRALLYGADLEYLQGIGFGPMMPNAGERGVARLSYRRHSLWENPSLSHIASNSLGNWGAMVPLTGIPGTIDARIQQARFRNGSDAYYERIWAGIRPAYQGWQGFHPVTELEWGTAGVDTAVAALVGSSNGYVMECDFSTDTTMRQRCSVQFKHRDNPVSALFAGRSWTPEHYPGRYLILLRYRLNGDHTQVAIKMKSGYINDTVEHPVHYVDNEPSWAESGSYDLNMHLLEMGEVVIPPPGQRKLQPAEAVKHFYMSFDAELLNSGTAPLQLDAICLIPTNHFISPANAQTQFGTPEKKSWVNVDERGVLYAQGSNPDAVSDPDTLTNMVSSANKWYLPTGDNILVIAAQEEYHFGDGSSDDRHLLDSTVDLLLSYYPRWRTYRRG